MTLALMQPYVFPYIGYFQLIHAVDRFVFYDDVNFIKQGWINRNRVLVNHADFTFSIPVEQISSFRRINETKLNERLYPSWKTKFLKTLQNEYRKAPCYASVYPLVAGVLETKREFIHELAIDSVVSVLTFLGLSKDIVATSTGYGNDELKAQDRVIDICKRENATRYVNVSGGKELYSKEDFLNVGIDLKFIKSLPLSYLQHKKDSFVPWLSIIDVLMFNEREVIANEFLKAYELE